MICKRCGLEVKPKIIKKGVFNNEYQCPECGGKFGYPTLLNKVRKVALLVIFSQLLGPDVELSN